MRLVQLLLAVALPAALARAADSSKTVEDDPCTVHSPNSGLFYDLRSISLLPPDPESHKKSKTVERNESWPARGWDYPANFTLNICAPVLEKLDRVAGVQESLWKNVSAYYKQDGEIYSIGQQASNPIFRGRKLVLEYRDGSPCPASPNKAARDDSNDEPVRRKSTTISFHCEKDPVATTPVASFVGVSPDSCAYFFEVRTAAACAGAEPPKETVGPAGVFGIILLIAVVVYFVGGIMYQRSVTHARGWRQIPNYSMWAGIGSFIKASQHAFITVATSLGAPSGTRVASDMFIIATSSCANLFPRSRGYRNLSSFAGSGRGRGGRHNEDENRLIDQLDEEWDE